MWSSSPHFSDVPELLRNSCKGEVSVTRCKFRCASVTDNGETKDFQFVPVYGDSEENKSFWKWTPSGELKFNCTNKEVNFVPGKEYYIDISEAQGE